MTGGTPSAYTTTYGYDPAGDETSATDPNGHATSWTYDGDRNQTSETDANGHTTQWTYTDRDQLHTVQGPDASGTQLTTYGYDAVGNETSATDPNAHTTSWTYDASNRLTTATDPLARSYTYSYDADDNITTEVTPQEAASPGHGTVTNSYDALDRLTGTSYSDGTPALAFGYDNDGQLTSNSNGTATDALTYDPAGQLTQLVRTPTTGITQTFTYGYDNAGNITSRTRPAGGTLTYTYDADNHPTTVVDGTQTSTAGYDPDGNMTSLTQPTSPTTTVQSWTYDHADQLSNISSTQGGSTLASYALTRDPAGNITAQTATVSGATTSTGYAYDQANRISEICPAATTCASPGSSTTSISYDKVGNRTGATITGAGGGTLTYSYDAANELTSAVNSVTGTTSYTSNALGEQTTAGSLTSSYNLAGQLTSTASRGVNTSYTYDPEGSRLTANASGGAAAGTTTYAWDPNTSDSDLPDLGAEQLPSGQVNDYDWLSPTLPVSQTRTPATGSSNTDYYLTDPQNSVSQLVSTAGAVTGSYAYDPFGNGTVTTGSDSGANPLRWTSAYQDPTGQYNNRARVYDPSQGLFTSTDPLAADVSSPSASTYLYAQQSPLNAWDPTGQKKKCFMGYCLTFDPEAGLRALVNIGRGASGGLTDKIADAISPGASCTVAQNSLDEDLGTAATAVIGGEEFETLLSSTKEADRTVVIGRDMTSRVIPYAERNGFDFYKGTPGWVPRATLEKVSPGLLKRVDMAFNKAWIKNEIQNGSRIVNIGQPAGMPPSDFYEMELGQIDGYSNYVEDFIP